MATLEQLEARIESLEATRTAQTPIIQRHELALDQIKPMYNQLITDIKFTFNSPPGNYGMSGLNTVFDNDVLTYATN